MATLTKYAAALALSASVLIASGAANAAQRKYHYPEPHRTTAPCTYPQVQHGREDRANYIIGTVTALGGNFLTLFDRQRGNVTVNVSRVPVAQRNEISQGDYVQIRGSFDGNTFLGTSFKVNPSRDDLAPGQNPCNIYPGIQQGKEDKANYVTGNVTDDRDGRHFTIYDRSRGNVNVDASAVANVPPLHQGEHVRVTGSFRGYTFYATGVYLR